MVTAARPAEAQTPARPGTPTDTLPVAPGDTARDSVLARLQRAEEAIALLREQLAAQAASATQTASRARFDLSGRVLLNGFSNSRRVNNVDVPQFVAAFPDTGRGALGASVRQTVVTGTAFVPRVLGGAFTGDVSVDFYGGQQPSPGGRHFPLVRLRNARGALRYEHVEIMAGQDVPLVAAIEPVSVAAVGVAEFGTAGNLWIWLPQLRLTLETSPLGRRGGARAIGGQAGGGPGGGGGTGAGAPGGAQSPANAVGLGGGEGGGLRLGVQAAVLAPNNGDAVGTFDTGSDAAERSRRPYLQARARARWGEEERAGEVGVGYHRGWIADPTGPSGLLASEATVVNALVPLGGAGPVRFDVRGEAYRGQALRGLGGGGIAQTFLTAGANTPATGTTPAVIRASVPLRTRGGWFQVNARYRQFLTAGAGCGVDAPRGPYPAAGTPQAALVNAAAPRRRNNVCEGHAIARPDGPVLVGLTYRRTRTRYAAGPLVNDHVNLAVGYQF